MAGRTIGHYRVLEKLGAGGMGDIYKAQDPRLNRFVAIKSLTESSAGDPERRLRFAQEAQAASALNHPNIITIYDILSEDGAEYMVMEYISGSTLADLIPKGGLGVAKTLQYGVQIADALRVAHAAGIVHRDLKPGNVMVTDSGLVKVLDFGLAKVEAHPLTEETQTVNAPLTIEGSILGTVSYMSPEQAQGKRVDARSDIFAFGVLLYEMVTGTKAFSADSVMSTITCILRDDVKPICTVVGGVPSEMEEVVGRALRKDPADRWQSMGEMLTALSALKRGFDSSGISYVQETASQQLSTAPATPKQRSRKWLPAVGIAALVIAGGIDWWWFTHGRARPVAPPAPTKENPAAASPASAGANPAPKTPVPAGPVLTNHDVIAMVKENLSPSLIIGQIRASETKFDLSTPEVILLSKEGVPEQIIDAMRNPKAARVPAVTPPPVPAAAVGRGSTASTGTALLVNVLGGIPFQITLAADVPAEAVTGTALRFRAAEDCRVSNNVVVAKGALVTGELLGAGKKFLGLGGKVQFKLTAVMAVDGRRLKIKASPGRKSDKNEQGIQPPGHRNKDLLAPAGSKYLAYFDGDQTVTVRK